eukprot:Awhi_evm2s7848
MVDLVGRRDATYIKHGSHVLDCYSEEHDKSSFCWIYEILKTAAHTPVHVPNSQRNLAEETVPITKLIKYNAYCAYCWDYGDKYRQVPRNEHDIRLPVFSTIDNRNSALER